MGSFNEKPVIMSSGHFADFKYCQMKLSFFSFIVKHRIILILFEIHRTTTSHSQQLNSEMLMYITNLTLSIGPRQFTYSN